MLIYQGVYRDIPKIFLPMGSHPMISSRRNTINSWRAFGQNWRPLRRVYTGQASRKMSSLRNNTCLLYDGNFVTMYNSLYSFNHQPYDYIYIYMWYMMGQYIGLAQACNSKYKMLWEIVYSWIWTCNPIPLVFRTHELVPMECVNFVSGPMVFGGCLILGGRDHHKQNLPTWFSRWSENFGFPDSGLSIKGMKLW